MKEALHFHKFPDGSRASFILILSGVCFTAFIYDIFCKFDKHCFFLENDSNLQVIFVTATFRVSFGVFKLSNLCNYSPNSESPIYIISCWYFSPNFLGTPSRVQVSAV